MNGYVESNCIFSLHAVSTMTSEMTTKTTLVTENLDFETGLPYHSDVTKSESLKIV